MLFHKDREYMLVLKLAFVSTDLVDFSDEEGYGKYLDLHECYSKYINLKGVQKIDYITYLTVFDQLFDLPKDRKNAAYKELVRYLNLSSSY